MEKVIIQIRKFGKSLFLTRAAGIYLLLFALAIAVGTFIENDYGTSSAQKLIYKSWWFSALLFLFGTTIIVNVFRYRMIQQRKWALATFHLSIIIILIGAGITRYFGYEGMMHIRENQSANSFLSSDEYVKFSVSSASQVFEFDEPVLFASLGTNTFEESYQLQNNLVKVRLLEFIPNPIQKLESSPTGKPTLGIVIAGPSGRQTYYIQEGEVKNIHGLVFNFSPQKLPNAINILTNNNALQIQSDRVLSQMTMATQQRDTLSDFEFHPLKMKSLYSDGPNNFVFSDFNEKGVVQTQSESPKVKRESIISLKLEISVNGEAQEIQVEGQKGMPGEPIHVQFGEMNVSVSYGSVYHQLPFSIHLKDFKLEKYPGTENPVSYSSDVVLEDKEHNVTKNYVIFMNNILDYDGYRFFQSSYDPDELGSYLSVNHDFWGTWISYIGYILLTIGMIASLFSSKSRFQNILKKMEELRKNSTVLLILFSLAFSGHSFSANAQEVTGSQAETHVVNVQHANQVSRLIVQDNRGRMKPMHTLTRELLRKIARTESINGLTADQVILGMFANPQDWIAVPMIKLGKHEKIQILLGITADKASYKDFFDANGRYILQEEMSKAYALQPVDRGVYEKELLKIDERVNIADMIFSGSILRLIPIPNDPNNKWEGAQIQGHTHSSSNSSLAEKFFSSYSLALQQAMATNDYSFANAIIADLAAFQVKNGSAVIPSPTKIKAEILLNNLNVFNRLAVVYALLGVAFLVILFSSVIKPNISFSKVTKFLQGIMILGFVFHTLGLGLRWFVSGRAPWSNSYESMIYIAFATVLAGVLFTRKSLGGMAATMILSATVLLVASLTYMDPEITPLSPVLVSYWLTIHVSLEAGSYGFLLLGAVIGMINLLLIIVHTDQNRKKIQRMVKELSYLSEIILIGGLVMISIGTYLGGVWANESWGRYWGWDAKETWALVTILVYAFILHMRIIPGLKSTFVYNISTIFGFATVIMTYYGVNYYLSGLHSYAAGDPVPIPTWVYIFASVIVFIGVLSYWRNKIFIQNYSEE